MNAISDVRAIPPPNHVQRLHGLMRSLAGPVARGLLSIEQAEAAILLKSLEAWRIGHLRSDPIHYAECLQHVLRQLADQAQSRTDTARGAIVRELQPLIAMRVRSNRLRAEAHDINAALESPMREWEVDEAVAVLCYHALHPEDA